jgi:hypothetical protein
MSAALSPDQAPRLGVGRGQRSLQPVYRRHRRARSYGARALLGERKSSIERYYYSAFDHAVNPAWSPDGATLYFIANTEVAWGSGDLWSVSVDEPAQRRKVLSEETTWSAHPEPAPAGRRLLYSSYRGRPWHQLWLTTTHGAAPCRSPSATRCAQCAGRPTGAHRHHQQRRGNTGLVVLR